MPINASPHYQKAEAEYLVAKTTEQKIRALKKMMALSPKHKGAENLNAQLKRRLAKLKYTKEKQDKSGKGSSSKHSIKKEEIQAVIVGLTNSGKSTLLSKLTNATPEIADYDFTTRTPIQGMVPFSGTKIQLIEIPAFESEYYDRGLVNTADVTLVLVNKFEEIGKLLSGLNNNRRGKLIVFNPKGKENKRKLEAKLKSKKYNFVILDLESKKNLEELKEKIFQSIGKIRIFTKPETPGSQRSERPMILPAGSKVKDIAERVLKNLSALKEIKIWGPSSKFPGQVVGLQHELKDLDTVEFKTR